VNGITHKLGCRLRPVLAPARGRVPEGTTTASCHARCRATVRRAATGPSPGRRLALTNATGLAPWGGCHIMMTHKNHSAHRAGRLSGAQRLQDPRRLIASVPTHTFGASWRSVNLQSLLSLRSVSCSPPCAILGPAITGGCLGMVAGLDTLHELAIRPSVGMDGRAMVVWQSGRETAPAVVG
jgi:hypothetical protein